MVKVIVIGVDHKRDGNFKYYLDETINLCEACNFHVVDFMSQKLEYPDPRVYLGTGKMKDLVELVKEHEVELVVTNDELKGSQNRNMEKLLDCRVMDRTQLILEIFAKRAQTKEAKLQVEIAQLKYQKPRMVGSYDDLDRQGGGLNAKGSGETKLEQDKRKIDGQIVQKVHELEKIVTSRNIQRERRNANNVPVVAIVGYTNAGKSTLLNSLVNDDKQVFEKDMLFATLDTSVRKIVDNDKEFLLTDTVGFVSNLPHELVKAFRSTLEEIADADLILHVSDASDPNYLIHQDVVKTTLSDLDCLDIPIVTVYNKCDILDIDVEEIKISARTKMNLDVLLEEIYTYIFEGYKYCSFELEYTDMSVVNSLRESHNLINLVYAEKITFDIYMSTTAALEYKKYIKE